MEDIDNINDNSFFVYDSDNQEFPNIINEFTRKKINREESPKKVIFKIKKDKMYKFFNPVFSLENILTYKFWLKEDQKSNVIETNVKLNKSIKINVTNEEITNKYKNILEQYKNYPSQKNEKIKKLKENEIKIKDSEFRRRKQREIIFIIIKSYKILVSYLTFFLKKNENIKIPPSPPSKDNYKENNEKISLKNINNNQVSFSKQIYKLDSKKKNKIINTLVQTFYKLIKPIYSLLFFIFLYCYHFHIPKEIINDFFYYWEIIIQKLKNEIENIICIVIIYFYPTNFYLMVISSIYLIKNLKSVYYLNDSMISKSIVIGIPIIFTISVNKIYISLKKKINFFILSSVIYCIDDCFPSLMEIIYSLIFQKTSEDSKNVEFNTVFLGKSGLNINGIGLNLNINE